MGKSFWEDEDDKRPKFIAGLQHEEGLKWAKEHPEEKRGARWVTKDYGSLDAPQDISGWSPVETIHVNPMPIQNMIPSAVLDVLRKIDLNKETDLEDEDPAY